MARRSGTEHIDRWPDVGSYQDLFNVAGSPNQDPDVGEGDRELVVGEGVYECVDPTLGAAIWALRPSDEVVLAEWNGTDLAQFTESGSSDWTTAVGPYGPDGESAIRWTTTVAGGTKDRYLIFDPGVALPDEYTVDFFIGPYSGNSNPLQRVMVKSMCHYVDSTHFVGVAPQGNATSADTARNAQSMAANGGAPAYGNVGSWVFPGGGFPIGRVRYKVSKSASAVTAAAQLWAGYSSVATAYATGPGDKVGIYVVHFGDGQAVGDSSYLYGLRIYAGHLP